MPPPPPPSKSYLLVFDSDSDDEDEKDRSSSISKLADNFRGVTITNNNVNINAFPKAPDRETCPICFLALPINEKESHYMICCGKVMCVGCLKQTGEVFFQMGTDYTCPYCRATILETALQEEQHALLTEKMDKFEDPHAMYKLAIKYRKGCNILPNNAQKHIELLRKAARLGHGEAALMLSILYRDGYPEAGIQPDKQVEKEYLESAAYRSGNVLAWHNLGHYYHGLDNFEAASYHFRTAASYGFDLALELCKELYKRGLVTKDELEGTLRAWKAANDEMDSESRKEAKRIYGPKSSFSWSFPASDD